MSSSLFRQIAFAVAVATVAFPIVKALVCGFRKDPKQEEIQSPPSAAPVVAPVVAPVIDVAPSPSAADGTAFGELTALEQRAVMIEQCALVKMFRVKLDAMKTFEALLDNIATDNVRQEDVKEFLDSKNQVDYQKLNLHMRQLLNFFEPVQHSAPAPDRIEIFDDSDFEFDDNEEIGPLVLNVGNSQSNEEEFNFDIENEAVEQEDTELQPRTQEDDQTFDFNSPVMDFDSPDFDSPDFTSPNFDLLGTGTEKNTAETSPTIVNTPDSQGCNTTLDSGALKLKLLPEHYKNQID